MFQEGQRLSRELKIPRERALKLILKEIERQKEETMKLMNKIYLEYWNEFADTLGKGETLGEDKKLE